MKTLCQTLPHALWINQYANQRNWQAHAYGSGDEILAGLDATIDCLVVAVSTTGTILGVARRLRQSFPKLRVVAVGAFGSVIFGAPPQPRKIPGLGRSGSEAGAPALSSLLTMKVLRLSEHVLDASAYLTMPISLRLHGECKAHECRD